MNEDSASTRATTYNKYITIPTGAIVNRERVLVIAKTAEEATGASVAWRIMLSDMNITGKGTVSLDEALSALTDPPSLIELTASVLDPVHNYLLIRLLLESQVYVSSPDRNWTAGTGETMKSTIDKTFPQSLLYTKRGTYFWYIGWLFLFIACSVAISMTINVLPLNDIARFVLSLVIQLPMGVFIGRTMVIKRPPRRPFELQTGLATPVVWYNHPAAEIIKIAAPALATIWVLIQMIFFFIAKHGGQ